MPAKKGNTYAEKWTRRTVLDQLAKIEAEAQKATCLWLGSALVKVGLYKDVWAYWTEKFADDDQVFRTIKKVEQIFEDRLFTKAVKGDVNSAVAIFGLKNNHYWTDKREIDHTTQGDKITDLTVTIRGESDPVTSEDDIDETI